MVFIFFLSEYIRDVKKIRICHLDLIKAPGKYSGRISVAIPGSVS